MKTYFFKHDFNSSLHQFTRYELQTLAKNIKAQQKMYDQYCLTAQHKH